MKPKHQYTIAPSLPENLQGLLKLAYNLRWTWHKDTIDLFRRLDRDLWEKTNHNPLHLLGVIKQETLEKALADDGFMSHMERVLQDLDRYFTYKSWYEHTYGKQDQSQIAYFSLEFGLTECMPDLLGRPGHPGRRPPEVRQRPGPAAGRRRAALPGRATSAST